MTTVATKISATLSDTMNRLDTVRRCCELPTATNTTMLLAVVAALITLNTRPVGIEYRIALNTLPFFGLGGGGDYRITLEL